MSEMAASNNRQLYDQEIILKAKNGILILVLNILLMLGALALFIWGILLVKEGVDTVRGVISIVAGSIYFFIVGPVIFFGLKVLKPNEALVLTLFGKYYGTLKGEGFFFVNPFVVAVNPAAEMTSSEILSLKHVTPSAKEAKQLPNLRLPNKKISLKVMTLNNDKQKINDQLGNPIIISIVVIWRVVNTVKAVFNVDNYIEYLSIQCDSALRNIVRLYPYDTSGNDNEKTLRSSSQEVAEMLKEEIQSKVEIAGLEILEARITHLAYAPEIAAAMLQRQQASAIIDARQMIVEGAVSIVEMALAKLSENEIVQLDEERKAAMVSNLLVVLCGNRDAQPVINSGSLY
ncbi:SPFH domain-containing protein [Moorella sulfitireducens (nom. illeg.)]|uniref:SPFH domain-containing protein n=1 Tax=Neomoorella sulfitireducens TaxID=2972948 RepID=UPI0021ABD3EA|nr:SPFH domain-containing protein [Moorella sulfitireducens]